MSRRERSGRPASRTDGIGGDRVEGRRAVRELLVAGRRRARTIWISTGTERSELLDEIADLARDAKAAVKRVPSDQLVQLARTDAPQGVVADADPLPDASVDELLRDPHAFLVALDGVTDPHNLGAILRTAEVAGATGALIPRHRAARITPTVAKAAAGAIEHLPIASVSGIPAVLDRARRADVWTVGLDAGGDQELFGLDLADRPIVLVLGAEGRGLARLTRTRCDVIASIPMRGHVESLNVSAAAALACFEVARRRGTVEGPPG